MRLWGPSPKLKSVPIRPIESLPLIIDGAAGTNMYQYKGDPKIEQSISGAGSVKKIGG